MGNQRATPAKRAEGDRQLSNSESQRPETAFAKLQGVLGNREGGDRFKVSLDRYHQTQGKATSHPLDPLMSSMGVARPTQDKPLFRGLSHELQAETASSGMVAQAKMAAVRPAGDRMADSHTEPQRPHIIQVKPTFRGLWHKLGGEAATPETTSQSEPVSTGSYSENKTGLPDRLKTGIEALSGIAIDDVRVHYNSPKPTQLQALAYTQGSDIHVAPGQEKHLPHEAWHVVQQKKGAVKPSFKLKGGIAINDSPNLEQEAEIMGVKAQTVGNQAPYQAAVSKSPQAPTATDSLHQLKSNPSSSGEVIQRQVDTWGGTFSTERYEPKVERFVGTSIGADIRIVFTPNQNCPKNISIGLIQIVTLVGASEASSSLQEKLLRHGPWAIDRAEDANPVYGSYDEDNLRATSLMDNPPNSEGNQLGKGGKNGQAATLEDTPVLPLNTKIQQGQYFETTAVVLEGPYTGLALGTVSWGWTKPIGESEAVCEPFAKVNDSGHSESFEQAKAAWNKLADQEKLVRIPDNIGAPAPAAGGGKKCCFLTTACVEYKGLRDDCEELTTLRQFRDTYLMQKPNGQELINLYYDYSPRIVVAIHGEEDEEEILEDLYQIIRRCVDAIKAESHEWAYQTYCTMVMQLKDRFIPEVQISTIY